MKTMKKAFMLAIFMIALVTVGCSSSSKKTTSEPVEILVAAAASLQNAMEEIQTLYQTAHPNVSLTFTFGSSGTLQQQIEQGAPVDVFMSAALKQMKALEDGGLILEDTKKELLENKIVLIVPKDSDLGMKSFEDILNAPVIALGEPTSVPAGQYAEEIFTSLSMLDQVKEKVTYGKDVTQVLTWVATGNADAGVVYATDAKSSEDVSVVSEAPADSTSKVLYPVAVIKETKVEEAARDFVTYLASEEAISVFEKYGFTGN
ncbi:MAG: molybdate ABC transporter substrate-binding protein [Anaerocolumna sp.]